jgi:hypothetical protein
LPQSLLVLHYYLRLLPSLCSSEHCVQIPSPPYCILSSFLLHLNSRCSLQDVSLRLPLLQVQGLGSNIHGECGHPWRRSKGSGSWVTMLSSSSSSHLHHEQQSEIQWCLPLVSQHFCKIMHWRNGFNDYVGRLTLTEGELPQGFNYFLFGKIHSRSLQGKHSQRCLLTRTCSQDYSLCMLWPR